MLYLIGAMTRLGDALYGIYVSGIFPVLVANDPEYRRCLHAAGLGWHPPVVVPPARLKDFQAVMGVQAWLGARKIEDAQSLAPDTIRVKPLKGPETLYRVAQRGEQAPPGIWWFNETVAQRCRDEAGPDPQKRLEWLRNVLAVCYNWSRFDRIERLRIRRDERIPAVYGEGLPMPHYKLSPYYERGTGRQVVDMPGDYWKQKGKMLMGGELQVVLPWVPRFRVAETRSL